MQTIEKTMFSKFQETITRNLEKSTNMENDPKKLIYLSKVYTNIYENVSIMNQVSQEDYNLCENFIEFLIDNIDKNIELFNNLFYLIAITNENSKTICYALNLMSIVKEKLEKIKPLDFIIEMNDNEIGPYDCLCEDRYHRILCGGSYDGCDGYDN
jgi:hypothetical protein